MADIRHRVGIAAPAERVYQALATTDGLSGWWTRDVQGDSRMGGKLEFYFGQPEPAAVMEVTDLVPGRRVGWRCVQGPDEWVGTSLAFDLTTSEEIGETAVRFTHADWRNPIDFSLESMAQAAAQAEGLREVFRGPSEPAPVGAWERLAGALEDDFNTPAALAVVHEWRDHDLIRRALEVFGLGSLGDQEAAPAEIVDLAERRVAARLERDFDLADSLRDEIEAAGWEMRDEPGGYRLFTRR